ncbi:MAG: hypothetical protein IJK83_12075 [Clostridiales bacterium]|nr:hypothetical protein [Clostridiales bacterium]
MSKISGTRFTTSSPFRFALLLIPFAIAAILGIYTVGNYEGLLCLWWAFILVIFGIATLPLAARLWGNSTSGGFFLSQPLGLVLTCLVLWTLTHLKLCRINLVCIIMSFLIVAAVCYIPKSFRKALKEKISSDDFIEAVVVEETAFLIVFFLMCYFKGFSPAINGQEKYMDYGFMMSMLRNDQLPANDMWLSGKFINYYYFGQYIWTVVAKVSYVPTGIAYNLAMCSATAIPFATSFSIGKLLIETASEKGFFESKAVKYISGLLTGCAVSIWGNSHSFFYDQKSIGNKFLLMFQKLGIEVGRTDNFYYPDSTRFIGWNPVTVNDHYGDYTIEEFPFYSYLVGDLHAHVISMMVVLLIAAVLLSMIGNVKLPSLEDMDIRHSLDNLGGSNSRVLKEFESTITMPLVLSGVLLGCAQMTNYWDFLIYFIFCSMGFFIVNTIRSAKFVNIPGAIVFICNVGGILLIYLSQGSNPSALFALEALLMAASFLFCVVSPTALPRTSFQMSFIFTLATLVSLPFNINFDMISNSLGKVRDHSAPFQLFVLYGTHVIICLVFVVVTIVFKNYRYVSPSKAGRKTKGNRAVSSVIGSEHEYSNPVQRFFAERNLTDVFVCGMTVVGLMLLAAPEIFYVRDIYTGGYLRSNTMFKFAFAAFIILSISMIYAIARLMWLVTKNGRYSTPFFVVSLVFLVMLFVPAHYTIEALRQRSGDLNHENYKTLDGTAYLDTHFSNKVSIQEYGNLIPYRDTINWFNENVEGSPVICEVYGDSYTDNCIVSAYTGLPTVFGWQTHEWLWRYHGIVDPETDTLVSDPDHDVWKIYITPRHNDVDTVYTDPYIEDVQSIINKYQIEYIILGELEFTKYNLDNSGCFEQLGEPVFRSGNLTVYKVTPVQVY